MLEFAAIFLVLALIFGLLCLFGALAFEAWIERLELYLKKRKNS